MRFSSGLPTSFPFPSTHHRPKGDDDDGADADGADVNDDDGADGDGINNQEHPGHQWPRVRSTA